MKRQSFVPSPPRLLETAHAHQAVLVQGNRAYSTPPAETERFCRLHARRAPAARRRSATHAWLAAAALLALALGVVTRPASFPIGPSSVTRAGPTAIPGIPAGEPVVTESAGIELEQGARRLRDGSVVRLLPGGTARLIDQGRRTTILLERGEVMLAVERRAAGAELEVRAAAYRFRVVGTRFTVTRGARAVALQVEEGRVLVLSGSTELASVSAGGSWRSPEPARRRSAEPSGSRAPASMTREARPEATDTAPLLAEPDCRKLARDGEPREAESCYLGRSARGGLAAETALLEVSRLRRDVLDDPSGALQALDDYRSRFPEGTLEREADIARITLLRRLGRLDQALSESQQLLDSSDGAERAGELHLLRAGIYRKELRNPGAAAREYAKAEALLETASEATYLRGSCLEELGDTAGAMAAYRRYLAELPRGQRASEARDRLERLEP